MYLPTSSESRALGPWAQPIQVCLRRQRCCLQGRSFASSAPVLEPPCGPYKENLKTPSPCLLLVGCVRVFLRSVASSSMLLEDGEVGFLELTRCAVLLTHKWLALRVSVARPQPAFLLRCSAATRFYAFITAVEIECARRPTAFRAHPWVRCARLVPLPHVFCRFVTEPRLASGLPKRAPVSKGSVPLHLCNNEKPNNQSPRTRSGQPLLNHRGRGGHRWEPVAATAPNLRRYLTKPG